MPKGASLSEFVYPIVLEITNGLGILSLNLRPQGTIQLNVQLIEATVGAILASKSSGVTHLIENASVYPLAPL